MWLVGAKVVTPESIKPLPSGLPKALPHPSPEHSCSLCTTPEAI